MKLLAPLVLIVAALALVVWVDSPPPRADLVFVNQNEVFTLDPPRMSYVQDLRLAHVLYEGLVRWDNADFSVVPAAAVGRPAVSNDGRTFTFDLRPDAVWSNGAPVTAHDFVYSWHRAILPDTAASYSNLFLAIDGAAALFDWRLDVTRAFTAADWPDDADPGRTTSIAGRLERLLAAEDLPPGVAAAADPAGVRRELDAIANANARPAPALRLALAEADATRTWLSGLSDPSSREAEAAWWWRLTRTKLAGDVRVRATSTRTLEVTLARRMPYFLDLLCLGVFHPVYRPAVEGWAEDAVPAAGWHAAPVPPFAERRWVRLNPRSGKLEQKHDWARPGRHVGNGTHVLTQWRYKRDLRLEANERYHDPQRVQSPTISARTIEDVNTAVLAFQSGQIDWLVDVSAEYQSDMLAQRDRYLTRYADAIDRMTAGGVALDDALARLPAPGPGERRNIHRLPTFGTDFYSFNCRPALADESPNPFAAAGVRRAFVLAVNKQTIVDYVTRLGEPVLTTFIPPGSIEGYESPTGLPYDADRARRELAAAGWSDRDGDGRLENEQGQPFPVIDLLYTTNIPRYKWISLNLKAQWERELGVPIELRGEETKFYRDDLRKGKFMIARGRWYGDYGDPTTFLDLCRTGDGNNHRGFSHPEVDRLLRAAERESDPAERFRQLQECERIICAEEVPMLFLCQLVQVYMYEPGRMQGLSPHPRLTQYLWQMKVERP